MNPKYLLVFIAIRFIGCTNEENNYNLKDLELNFGVKRSEEHTSELQSHS